MKNIYVFLLVCIIGLSCYAQVTFTANDTVRPYSGTFGYGTNAGWFPPHSNYVTANLAAGNASAGVPGAGCRSIRGALPDNHLTNWGTNVDLGTWQHYNNLGMIENVAFIGYPHSSHQETAIYCPSRNARSGMFTGMYLPIWDGGANGTPVNENNTYAMYLWNMVNVYKNYVTFYEVWNEPDFDNGQRGWRGPSDPTSWWGRDDFGCELVRFNGSIYDYIRLLRVSWEVIKYLDPDAYITTGGIGYESFLDAVLRNTDNPVDGSVTAAYPLKGGAYFDCLSYHVYPQFEPEVRHYSNALGGWVNNRHSDGAANGVIGKKERFEQVLNSRGYDGTTYPKKRWILTEHNIGRRPYGTSVGGEDIQRNYQIKTMVTQQLADIDQAYVYGLAETEPLASAGSTFDLMGLYAAIANLPAYSQPLTSAGIANRTMQNLLYGMTIDKNRTIDLNLPAGVKGGAFRAANGAYTYVLWAETTVDFSETASATYSFPASLGLSQVTKYEWDYINSGTSVQVSASNVSLTGTPVFLAVSPSLPVDLVDFQASIPDDRKVQLDWETSSETDNAFFTIERSADGVLFENLFQVETKGNDGGTYQAHDYNPLKGKNYYRLKQTDIDGQYSFSNVVEVFFDPAQIFFLETYPTPVNKNQRLNLEFALPVSGLVQVELRDLQGRLLWTHREQGQVGENHFRLALPDLAAGCYYLVFEAGKEKETRKVLIN